MTLAEKIKERRLSFGMTQSDLCGTFMTRNMLSEIEHGVALPSYKTLLYLAKHLDVSPGYLLSETMTLLEDRKCRFGATLEMLFKNRKFAECIEVYNRVFENECDNELAYLMASVCLSEAEICAEGGSVNTALSLLDKMEDFCAKTEHETSHLKARAALCRAMSKDPLTPQYALDRDTYFSASADACNRELYHYLTDDRTHNYKTEIFRAHIEAKKLMQEYRYTEAIASLNRILDNRLTEQISVLVIYRVYSDLEVCYRERKDYENAYKCSEKKHILLASFRA